MHLLLYYFGVILFFKSAKALAVLDTTSKNGSMDNVSIQDISKQAQTEVVGRPLIPTRDFCGYQRSDEFFHKIVDTTLITEFPWLARLLFAVKTNTSDFKVYGCLGSLINARYVLTSASCIPDDLYTVREVRLGEYNIVNETDCVNEMGILECSDSVKDFGIAKVIVHENYNVAEPAKDNIALLRLDKTVRYSDYIRPICLPFPGTTFAKVGDTLTTSGWGFINKDAAKAVVKKRILGTLISFEKCYSLYKEAGVEVSENNNICTMPMGNNTELTCIGDAGSPVIFSHNAQWHQEGIVTIGLGKCVDGFPQAMTKVADYLDWIVQNIEQ